MNIEFEKFIEMAGGTVIAGKIINCTMGQISHIRTGRRDVSKNVAKLIIDKYPELSLEKLLFPDGEQAA